MKLKPFYFLLMLIKGNNDKSVPGASVGGGPTCFVNL